jgi:hypothetical protein
MNPLLVNSMLFNSHILFKYIYLFKIKMIFTDFLGERGFGGRYYCFLNAVEMKVKGSNNFLTILLIPIMLTFNLMASSFVYVWV